MRKEKKNSSKTIKLKSILKKSEVSLKIKEKEIPIVLGDTNRFFNSTMEETKNSFLMS